MEVHVKQVVDEVSSVKSTRMLATKYTFLKEQLSCFPKFQNLIFWNSVKQLNCSSFFMALINSLHLENLSCQMIYIHGNNIYLRTDLRKILIYLSQFWEIFRQYYASKITLPLHNKTIPWRWKNVILTLYSPTVAPGFQMIKTCSQ